jgi:multidrug efflux pump subunit AcrB
MLENIFRHREAGDADPEHAAHVGAAEVQSAVIASTLTNLAAVVPFLLISGLAALIFRELILTISFAILASLAVALTVVPMMSAQLARIRFASGLGARSFWPLPGRGRCRRWNSDTGYRRISERWWSCRRC